MTAELSVFKPVEINLFEEFDSLFCGMEDIPLAYVERRILRFVNAIPEVLKYQHRLNTQAKPVLQIRKTR